MLVVPLPDLHRLLSSLRRPCWLCTPKGGYRIMTSCTNRTSDK